MKFVLLLSAPANAPATRRALRFAQELITQGQQITRIFLTKDAVHLASSLQVLPRDELQLAKQWQDFVQQQKIDAVVCISGALRRGVVDQNEAQRYQLAASNLAAGFVLSGLGQLHEAIQQSDRVVHFRGVA